MKQFSAFEVASLVKGDLKKRGLTQKKLSVEAGVSQQWLTRVLSGDSYLTDAWARWFETNLGYNYEFLTTGVGPLRKNTTSFEALCSLVRQLRILQLVERRMTERNDFVSRSKIHTLAEKKETQDKLRKIRKELHELQSKIDNVISLNDNELFYNVWKREQSM